MKQILRNLRGLWCAERLLFCIMTACIFSSALLLQFSYGLWQNYHVTLQESADDLKELVITVADGQTMPVGTMRDYIRALPEQVTANAVNIFVPVELGCPADHISRSDAEWEALRREYAPLVDHEDIPDSVWQENSRLIEQYGDAREGIGQEKRRELFDPYRVQDVQHMDLGETALRFTYRNGDFAPSDLYQENLIKNGAVQEGDRFFTKEEYATGARVVYNTTNDDVMHYLAIDENHISLWGESYEVIAKDGQDATPDPPVTAVPADAYTKSGSLFGWYFERNITKKDYDAMKSLADEMMPGVLLFPDLPFPDNDSMYLSRNIMLIAALIAVLSVLNFVMLYYFILQRRSRSLAIFRMTGCTAGRAVRMYLSECLLLGIPVYFAGLGVFLLLMKRVLSEIFPFMEAAFDLRVYASIFGIWIAAMLLLLTGMISRHVRHGILDEYYGRTEG